MRSARKGKEKERVRNNSRNNRKFSKSGERCKQPGTENAEVSNQIQLKQQFAKTYSQTTKNQRHISKMEDKNTWLFQLMHNIHS
jgi:hypothetical protein